MLPLFILNHQTPNDNPPSYDSLKEGSDGTDNKHPPQLHSMIPGPSSYSIHPGTTTGPSPVLYHYRNPLTQDTVVSLLPPDHPEMICLQSGEHITQTKFGILGILAAVFWFPLGVGLCLLDRRVKCRRCGQVIEDGMCS
ncbi:hypothetical protein C8R41DRAFT_752049 [Lentinula lateritia]|uniref:Brain protein I3 n=1 Tax=Lentinula lateritia TaxID=40482 RepID=A0ABQ8VYY6_9AGAR|nr:hypothetical protein C8R41DRAFT_752049 [Lentinula lateritia]